MTPSIVSDGSCAEYKPPKTDHDTATWLFIRTKYYESVGENVNIEDLRKEGILVPYEVRYDPKRGRGVFVTEPVKKGTRMWDDSQLASFKKRDDFVEFLEQLPHDLQCDILLWAYVYKGTAWCDLDPGSFINHGETAEVINMGTSGKATRDIEAGEPILQNYTKFIEYDSLSWFDEIRSKAWKKEKDATVYHTTDEYNRIGAPEDDQGTQSPFHSNTVIMLMTMFLSFMLVAKYHAFSNRAAAKMTKTSTEAWNHLQ